MNLASFYLKFAKGRFTAETHRTQRLRRVPWFKSLRSLGVLSALAVSPTSSPANKPSGSGTFTDVTVRERAIVMESPKSVMGSHLVVTPWPSLVSVVSYLFLCSSSLALSPLSFGEADKMRRLVR